MCKVASLCIVAGPTANDKIGFFIALRIILTVQIGSASIFDCFDRMLSPSNACTAIETFLDSGIFKEFFIR
jgi:hypothetical protein